MGVSICRIEELTGWIGHYSIGGHSGSKQTKISQIAAGFNPKGSNTRTVICRKDKFARWIRR